jgi:hypothetical protein
MKVTQPESFHGLLYVLKILSEVDGVGGVEALAKREQVLCDEVVTRMVLEIY